MRVRPGWIKPFRLEFDSKICLVNPNSFLKNVRFHQWFSIFFTSRTPPKLHGIWPPEPSSQNVLFQGHLQETKISVKNVYAVNTYSNMCTRFLDFSKIADLQARSAALGAAL